MVRAKFTCIEVLKVVNEPGFSYTSKFVPVTTGSEENESFFKYTPWGEIVLNVVSEDYFIPGKDYYVDLTEVE